MSLDKLKEISEIFQSFSIGIGALLGGLGALKVSSEWAKNLKRKLDARKWRKRFPKDKFGEQFDLVYKTYENVIGGGVIYVRDKRTKTKHWVADEETLKMLGFNLDEAKGIAASEFDGLKTGDEINLAN